MVICDLKVAYFFCRKFLKENAYYDEEVASKLLSEQGLYALLCYFSKVTKL